MLPGRLLDWACFLAIVLSVHAAYVAPSRLAKELRAVACCAKVCPRGAGPIFLLTRSLRI
jgi:hypothetical protein